MLENTLYKLKEEKSLKIAYFGGSITEGVGASDRSRFSWASRTTAWFKKSFPDAKIEELNASIGGTGSDFGVARVDDQVIGPFHPDLIFIEFVTNDSIWQYHNIQANVEGIVRKLRRDNRYIDIVLPFACTVSDDESLTDGNNFESRSAHSSVAYHFGDIPMIEMGEALRVETIKAGGDWMTYTTDSIHPNDKGYEILSDTVIRHLSGYLLTKKTPARLKENALPKVISRSDRSYAYSFGLEDIYHSSDFVRVDKKLERYDHYYKASKPGAVLKFKWKGRKIGIEILMTDFSGEFSFKIDDGETFFRSGWDEQCSFFDKTSLQMLNYTEIEDGEHTLEIRLTDKKVVRSKGFDLNICRFYIL